MKRKNGNAPTLPPAKGASKRKRGAPRGNRNALKHGFYARSFSASEKSSLDLGILGDFKDEIPLLRVLIARTAQSLKEEKDLSFEGKLCALRTFTLAFGRLESLTRSQKIMEQGLPWVDDPIEPGQEPESLDDSN
jgi:hypothetical protein